MVEPFIPLLPDGLRKSAGPATPARLNVLPQPVANDSFDPLTAGSSPVNPGTTSACAEAGTAPQVTLLRDGDRVTHIRVQCGCGQVAELECVY